MPELSASFSERVAYVRALVAVMVEHDLDTISWDGLTLHRNAPVKLEQVAPAFTRSKDAERTNGVPMDPEILGWSADE